MRCFVCSIHIAVMLGLLGQVLKAITAADIPAALLVCLSTYQKYF
jgi:hypothetical protein